MSEQTSKYDMNGRVLKINDCVYDPKTGKTGRLVNLGGVSMLQNYMPNGRIESSIVLRKVDLTKMSKVLCTSTVTEKKENEPNGRI